ncbi:MAG: glutamate--tRNA ligase [Actinomycetia bacterium]|nr:glutamate--tRNA ligase [Actinomycetes bacterium]
MTDQVVPRLRFAPAPTGFLHLGSARTALFNWLYARHTGGELVLRVEDTNAELARPELIDNIYESLEWLGIDWDGEPVRQSQRDHLYQEAIDRLVGDGRAYEDDGAIRFRVGDAGSTSWDDVVRGTVTFEHEHVEDFVIRRSDGSATFFLANAVDDLDLGITHVVRGEDLVNVTPKVIMLRRALGATDLPVFAHLPLIVNDKRKKLSKRRDDVSLASYRERGIIAPAMANYLALLGWGPPDDVEVRPMSEIVELFELTDINASAAMFDLKKLTAINGDYIRAMSVDDLADAIRPYIDAEPWGPGVDDESLRRVVPLLQERAKLLEEAPGIVDFLFFDDPEIDEASWQKIMTTETALPMLDAVVTAYADIEWASHDLHAATLAAGEALGLKLGKAQAPVRVAVTGRTVGPPLFESLEMLGRDESLRRIEAARTRLT